MIRTHHHIIRGWRHERQALRFLLALVLPALFLAFVAFHLHISLVTMATALGLSLWRLWVAYCISLLLGVAIAVVVGNTKNAGASWIAIFDVAQNIPSFALIPLFVLLMGYSSTMVIIFAATSIIWPILFSVLTGIRNAHPSLNEAATIFGARGWKRIWHYLVPLSYPAIITGSIVGISIGWEAVIGAEIIGSLKGIGLFLNNASAHDQKTLLFAGLASLLLVVFVINRLIWSPLLKHTYEYSD